MTKLEDIEAAVEQLDPEDLKRFRAWFDDLQARLWDQQIERDIKAGKLDKHAERWRADYKAGKVAALNSLKGQVMKLSKGKANPALVGEILERKLKG